jgi:precorrin-6A/cobalt-precorrin-6A reductase
MTLLLLSGTGEAIAIAQALRDGPLPVIASLAGATRLPREMAVPTRAGGFGGDEGFRAYLREAGITAVLDATHPFAARISLRSARICHEENLPYCQLLRPEWQQQEGDRWTMIESEEAAAEHIAPSATVFLATGRQTLDRFENLSVCRLICRQIDPPDREFPFANGEFLVGRPPFSVEEEVGLFRKLKIDWLVVKNAGGEAPRSKLVAARQLGLRVAMINRPKQPQGLKVTSVQAALDWVRAL